MFEPIFATGVLLLFALWLGRVFARFHLPKVTGYMLSGVLLGPSFAQIFGIYRILSPDSLHQLNFISDIGIALIMVTVGSHFNVESFKKCGSRIFLAGFIESLVTFLLVTIGIILAGFSIPAAVFMGIMAMNTAPGATQMVIREYQSEGKLSDIMLILIGLNNFLSIVVFVILYHFVTGKNIGLSELWFQLLMPVGAGFSVGFILSSWEQRLVRLVDRQIAMLGIILVLVAASRKFGFNLLYSSLIAGLTIINISPHKNRLLDDIHKIDYPIYILFFALAGTHLQLETVPAMGVVGIIYVLMRSIGKVSGNFIGMTAMKSGVTIRNNIGMGMVCQAGIAIGLSSILAANWSEGGGKEIQNIILASVVLFEAIGPILTRISLVRAGEVTMIAMVTSRAPVGVFEGFHDVLNQFGKTMGFSYKKKFSTVSEVPIKLVMRRHVETIHESMNFNDVLKTMGHSRYDRLPVVNSSKHFIGVIHYRDLSDVIFVKEFRSLIVAKDIAVPPVAHLTEKDPIEKALDVFNSHPNISYLFIFSSKNKKEIAGVVRHNDVLSSHGLI